MKKWFSIIVVAAIAVLTPTVTQAQSKGGEQQIAASGSILKLDDTARPAKAKAVKAEDKSAVKNHATVFRSHIKSLGTVGRYEIVQLKIRGFDGANLAGYFVFDAATGEIVSGANSAAPGLGVAVVNGAASVGSALLFGKNIRPDRHSINNGSHSGALAAGGTASADSSASANANSNATGGTGGSSTATGGTGNGGAGGNGTGNGGTGGNGQFVPPGHINNPSDNH